jgi:hypothetical protein
MKLGSLPGSRPGREKLLYHLLLVCGDTQYHTWHMMAGCLMQHTLMNQWTSICLPVCLFHCSRIFRMHVENAQHRTVCTHCLAGSVTVRHTLSFRAPFCSVCCGPSFPPCCVPSFPRLYKNIQASSQQICMQPS